MNILLKIAKYNRIIITNKMIANVSTQSNSDCNKASFNQLCEHYPDEDVNSLIIVTHNDENKYKRKRLKYKTKSNYWKRKRTQVNNVNINMTKDKDKKVDNGLCKIKHKHECKISNLNKFKTNENMQIDWNIMEILFEIENNDTLSSLFKFDILASKQKAFTNLVNTKNPEIEETYALCKIINKNTAHYLLYNIFKEKITLLSNLSSVESSTETSTEIDYKTNVNNAHDDINKSNNIQPQLIKAFQINSLSKKILALEKSVDISMIQDIDNSYLANQLLIKNQMLKETIKNNLLLTTTIGKNRNNNIVSKKDMHELCKEQKKNKQIIYYKSIYKRLSEGLKDKTYASLIADVNPLRLKQGNNQQEIKKYYENKSECCVCLAYCPYSSTHVAYCYKCNVGIHTTCYGLSHMPIWFKCDLCWSLNNNSSLNSNMKNLKINNIKCIFCLQSYGALKRIGTKLNWGHITCVLISSYAHFADYIKLDSVIWINSLEETILLTNIDQCDICYHTDGEKFICTSCGRHYHFFCAYFEGYQVELIYNTTFSNKSFATIQVKQCAFEKAYNRVQRNEQSTLRKLIYHKY